MNTVLVEVFNNTLTYAGVDPTVAAQAFHGLANLKSGRPDEFNDILINTLFHTGLGIIGGVVVSFLAPPRRKIITVTLGGVAGALSSAM